MLLCTLPLPVSVTSSHLPPLISQTKSFLVFLCRQPLPGAHRFGQAALVHVLVGQAPLPAPTGVVHGPRGAGHPVAVVAGVGGVVGAVGMVVVMVVAAGRGQRWETLTKEKKKRCSDEPSALCEEQPECGMFSSHNTANHADVPRDKSSPGKNMDLLGWRGRWVVVRRCQTEGVA